MPRAPTASIVIPTRSRPEYLDVALRSIVPQAANADAEIVVASDGPDGRSEAVARGHGASFVSLRAASGVNATRNAGIAAARSDLLVFVDDDVDAPPGWLQALLDGVRAAPDREVFGGPIVARLEGGGPRGCGRDSAPITSLDLGEEDRDVPLVWGANMAIRRSAFDAIGPFFEELSGVGDEEEWERRYTAERGRIRYLASAGLEHRRAAPDATIKALARAAYRQGRAARRHDARRSAEPSVRREVRTLAGCAWHTVRRRCLGGIVMGAHSAGRLREALSSR